MNRRRFLRTIGLGAATLPFGELLAAGERGDQKPNIILILADDLGYGDVSCYGNTTIQTPNIDALARGGMRFTDFHSNGPVCSPTRVALLTGRYQQRCGVDGVFNAKAHRQTGMPLKEVTFAEVLKAAGYATALFGKWHLGYPTKFNPTKQGFDVFRGYVSGNVDYHSHIDQQGYEDWWKGCELVPEEGYTTDLITAHGERFIEQHKDEPFCLYLAHESPHYPYQGREDKADRRPGNAGPAHGSRADNRGAYKEMIEVMDEGIGRILKAVRRLGLERKTFVFFCSDNGATSLGSNGALRGHKGSLWEGGHRVPGIAWWPGKIKPGPVTHETALTMDLFPTLASIGGTEVPAKSAIDGIDLLPVLLNGKKLPERSLFWKYRAQKSVRKGSWKLLCLGNKLHLYNLADDLSENKDLARTEIEKVGELLRELAQWEKNVSSGVRMLT